ncbi:hypothetical protein V2G26_014356 [Clonostachys chloroleuca]
MSPYSLLLTFGSLAAAAFVKDPEIVNPRGQKDSSWSPARETSVAEVEARAAEQWSPRPTDGPGLDAVELFPRLDGYTLPKGTCGFVSSNEVAYGCINTAATCTYSDDYIGCCVPNQDCSRVQTTCINSAQAATGACNLPKDFHTLCCTAATLGQCWTWLFSTTSGGNTMSYSFLDCSTRQGTGTLLAYDPTWSRTHIPSTSTSSSSSSSSTSSSTRTSSAASTSTSATGGGGGSSTNVGAIAGGTVGGVAALALVGVAAFLLIRRRKKNGEGSEVKSSPPAPSTAHPSTTMSPPPPTITPSSPGNTTIYPSGVPTNFTGYSPSPGYEQMSPQSTAAYPMYPNQQPYAPPQFAPGQQPQQPYYPQGPYGYQPQNNPSPDVPSPSAPSPGVPPSHGGPSPGAVGIGAVGAPPVPPPQHQQHATELPTINPIGNESNRAELQ